MRKHYNITLWVAAAVVVAAGVAFFLRAKAPPEAARLLPESDAILYIHLKPLRSATHFDQTPMARSADFQHFIDATGIVPERDLDAVAFALHQMPDPHGPNGPVAYSEVFVGRFDGARLSGYLASLARSKETYAGHDIYSIPIEGRTLRITQLGYDMIAASNMPTAEQVHSMLDRERASALWNAGSSLLAARYGEVPQLPLPSEAWAIGHIGLPFAEHGKISLFGLELPLSEDTDLVASVRYSGSIKLRIEEIAPTEPEAAHTVETMNTALGIFRGIDKGQQDAPHSAGTAAAGATPGAQALRDVLGSIQLEQHKDRAILTASATPDQLHAIATAHPVPPAPAAVTPAPVAVTTSRPHHAATKHP